MALPVVYSDAEGMSSTCVWKGCPKGRCSIRSLISWVPTYDQAGRRFPLEVREAALPILALPLIDFGDVAAGQVVERTYSLHNSTNLTMEITRPRRSTARLSWSRPIRPCRWHPGATIVRCSSQAVGKEGECFYQVTTAQSN